MKLKKIESDNVTYLYNDPETPFYVDDLIDLLLPHKGKRFINTAAENTSFKIDDTSVQCDTFDYWWEMDDLAQNDEDDENRDDFTTGTIITLPEEYCSGLST